MANIRMKDLVLPGLDNTYTFADEASEYSTSATYKAGEYCIYDGKLYRCKQDIDTAEVWTAAHWQLTKVGTELSSQSEQINALNEGGIAQHDAINFWGKSGVATKLGLTITQVGNLVTIDGVYTASARRRFNLSGNLEDGTSVSSSWYSTAKAPIKNGAIYQVHVKPISGTITYPSGNSGPSFNIQTYSTSGANNMNAYIYSDRISEPFVAGNGVPIGCVVITINKDFIFSNYKFYLELAEVDPSNSVAYVSTTGDDTASGSKIAPLKTINKALSCGFRNLRVAPGIYKETISLTGGKLSITKWDDSESFSDPFRSKIEIINGTALEVEESGTTNIYQASYTASADSNIYKVFVSQTLTPTTQGSITLEYNAMLIGDKPNTASGNNKQRLYTPVLTETELSDQGTFWYNGSNLIKFHPWGNTLDDAYYIPDDSTERLIELSGMESVTFEDIRAVGAYTNCVYIHESTGVEIIACEIGLCGKGNGLRLDNVNAVIKDCNAFGCAADGFNIHQYGDSIFYNCSAFYCGDDGISHHQGCTGVIDGGEWAYCGTGSGNGAGVAPTFGSKIDTRNIYSHHNHLGIMQEGLSGKRRPINWSNNVVVDNDTDFYINYYDVTSWNCVYKTKNVLQYGTLTEINNTILT